MKIQEIPLTQADTDSLLAKLKSLVSGVEAEPPRVDHEILQALADSVATFGGTLCFTDAQKDTLWKLSFTMWNRCVDLGNAKGSTVDEAAQASLRQAACDILLLAGASNTVHDWEAKVGFLLLKTGELWLTLKNYKKAEANLKKATEVVSRCDAEAVSSPMDLPSMRLEIFMARAKVASALKQLDIAGAMLDAVSETLISCPHKMVDVAEDLLFLGKDYLKEESGQASALALRYLERAYEISSCATTASADSAAFTEKAIALRITSLRFLAGAHLQNEKYNECLRCCSLLKLNTDHYPSWAWFLELKSLASLKRYDEAAHEFKLLCKAKDITLEILCASFDAIIQADTTFCIDAAKAALFEATSLVGKDNRALFFAVERLLSKVSATRVAAALSILKSDACQSTLRGGGPGQDQAREGLFLLIWNGCASSFHAKDYQSALKLAEACLLLLTDNQKVERAKTLRVISLSAMAVSQMDLAMDSICLAEELDPCIASVFLKFKLCLQRNSLDHAKAMLLKMGRSSDFDPDFFALASHEALACGHKDLAAIALRSLLDLHAEGKGSKCPEAVVVRSLIQLLEQDPDQKSGVLDLFLHAKRRAGARLEAEASFFGEGEEAAQEIQWFAVTALTRGIECAKGSQWKCAAEYLACSSAWFPLLPEEKQKGLGHLSMLLSAATLLSKATALEQDKAAQKEMEQMLSKCEAAMGESEASYLPLLRLLAFEFKCRCGDAKGLGEVLDLCKATPGLTPNHFFRLSVYAASAKGQLQRNVPVAIGALRAGLDIVLANPTPDMELALSAMRTVLQASERSGNIDDDLLQLYRVSFELLGSLPAGNVSASDAAWFVSTAWNKAPLLLRFQRQVEAREWMRLALEFCHLAPALQDQRKAMMEEALEGVERDLKAEAASSSMEE